MNESSSIIIGCMSWGKWGKQLSNKEQASLIDFCVDIGNLQFDHADIYGDYTTEGRFGAALAESSTPRSKIEIITKCGIQLIGGSRSNRVKHYDYTKEYIIKSVEHSLTHFRTDYIDTLLLHRPSPLMNSSEIAEAVLKLRQQGKIRKFGVSNFSNTDMALLQKDLTIDANQIEFSLSNHKPMLDGTLNYMQIQDIKPMCWSPLGNIFKKQKVNNTLNDLLQDLAAKYSVEISTVLLSWILKHPAKISPVIGTTQKSRILEANKATKLNLELEDYFLLLEAATGHSVP